MTLKKYLSIVLKLLSLGAIIAAAGFWGAAGVDTRPKYRDEQTLIGGTIWSQLVIPIGLVISQSINEELDFYVHAYYLLSGIVICSITGVVLLLGEYKSMMKFKHRREDSSIPNWVHNYDKIYLSIGVLSLVAAALTIVDFTSLLIL